MNQYKELFQEVRKIVEGYLGGDKTGHGMDHIDRVFSTSIRFADFYPEADKQVVGLAALLHDVDDYKLVGKADAEKLTNTHSILSQLNISQTASQGVINIVSSLGYSKSLEGIRPESLEGKIVSDADMCDAIGANGIVRCLTYSLSRKGSNSVFDSQSWPDVDMSAERYSGDSLHKRTDNFINHFFEKLLKLKQMIFTEPGKQEAARRDQLMVDFLAQYFTEQELPEWSAFLEEYLARR